MTNLPPPPHDDLADLERSTGPGLPKPILIGGVVVLALVVAIVVMAAFSKDDTSAPSPTSPPSGDVPYDPDGEVVPTESTPSTSAAPVLPPVPEPFNSLDVGPNVGCDSDCTSGLSYTVIGPDNKREVAVADGGSVTVTVTLTNTSSFEFLLANVDRQDEVSFSPQLAKPGTEPPSCPNAGDTPLKVAPRAETSCQLTYTFTNAYGQSDPRLTIDAEVQYLTLNSEETDFDPPIEVDLASGSNYITIVVAD